MPVNPGSVLLVTPIWARDGGVGAHVKASAKLLAERGVDVRVLVARIESSERPTGVSIVAEAGLFDREAPAGVRMGDALASSPEVIHVHQVDEPALIEAMRAVAPVVMSAHGYNACTSGVYHFRPGEECTRGHGPGCVPNLLARGCAHLRNPTRLPSMYRHATRGVDALTQADLAISYSTAVDRHLAANGLTRRAIVPYFPTLVPKQGTGHSDRRRVLFAGRIVPSKGVGVLIRAAREVEAEFVICGDGQRLDAMRRLAERLGVAQAVSFRGWLDPEQLAEELAIASLIAVPSVWPEPFGLVGIEGFAAGRPAIASATGGIADWLDDGVSGTLVAPGDARALARALDELLSDPERQSVMGAAGRTAAAARFSPERHLELLLDAYRRARSTWQSARSGARVPAPVRAATT
jgi:glycosyltransferase involved in cell wall biosynthesis